MAPMNTEEKVQYHAPGERRLLSAIGMLCAIFWGGLAAADEPSRLRFTDITSQSGLDFTMTSGKLPSTQIIEVDGGGLALFDYDNDGDLDAFFANGATMADPENGPGCRLYANQGGGSFENVTQAVKLNVTRWAMGVAIGDYDADGFDDIYITCYGPNILLRNISGTAGQRAFQDVSATAGVAGDRWSTSAAFGDIDGDGDLDLYVVNYLEFDTKNPPAEDSMRFMGAQVMAGPAGLTPQHDILYENLGTGTFRDITTESGCLPETAGFGLVVAMFDADADARQDIFVGNDSTENFLWHNEGDRKFANVGRRSGISANADGGTQATMGIAIGDVDGNSHPDVFTTNFSSDTNTLHLNLGKLFFDDRTSQFGLGMISRPFLNWGTGFYDFDADGDEDLFITSGHVYPQAATHKIDSDYEQPPLLFERSGPRFERNTDAGPMFQQTYRARACAFGDLDNDNDIDVVMTTLNGPVYVLRNDSGGEKKSLIVELQDTGGNRHALGSMVELIDGGRTHRRWLFGGSFQSSNAPYVQFCIPDGSGENRRIKVTWPDGKTTDHAPVPAEGRMTIDRPGRPTGE
jgi:hypothetical protein